MKLTTNHLEIPLARMKIIVPANCRNVIYFFYGGYSYGITIGRVTYFDPDHEGEHLCEDNHLFMLSVPR